MLIQGSLLSKYKFINAKLRDTYVPFSKLKTGELNDMYKILRL